MVMYFPSRSNSDGTQPKSAGLHSGRPAEDRARTVIPAAEQGYVMLIAIFLLALLVLSLAVAAPQMAKSIQRDRELETYHRGMQYRRAVQLYYRKFHAYPPSLDALVKTQEIRFLRKKYDDPMTGKADWKPITFGQNKTPTAMGFFGQPLAGNASSIAGVGPSGGNGLTGSTPGTGGFSLGGGTFGGGSSGGSPSGGFSLGGTDNGPGSPGSTPGTSGSATGTGSTGSSDSGTGLTGQTFGGAGIIGFEPASPKQAILVYKKKDHYNEWEFTYDPLSDMQTMGGGNAGAIGQPAGGTSNPIGTPVGSPGTGSTFGGSGGGFGSSPSPTPSPMPPDTPAPQ